VVAMLMLSALPAAAQDLDFVSSFRLGGPGSDLARDVVFGAGGRSYVIGSFRDSADFGDGTSLTSVGDADVFVAKYDADGSLLWVRQGGGVDLDQGHAVAIDGAGNVLAGGQFRESVTFGPFTLGGPSIYGAFLVKYDPDGNVLWAREASGPAPGGGPESGGSVANAVAVDATDHVVVAGQYIETLSIGPFTLPNGGANEEGYAARYDADGNVLWAEAFPGTFQVHGRAVAVDAAGEVYVAGSFGHLNFGGTGNFGATTLTSAGGTDVFLTRLSAADGSVVWVRQAGSTNTDAHEGGFDLVTDAAGTSVVAGAFRGTASFGTGTLVTQGDHDFFLAAWDVDGDLQWAHAFGSTARDHAESVAVDASGRFVVTGFFEAPITLGATTLTPDGFRDVYVAEIADDGTVFSAVRAGGPGRDEGTEVAVGDAGRLAVAGLFESSADFGSNVLTSAGEYDAFVAELRGVPELRIPTGLGAASGETLAVPIELTVTGEELASVALSVDFDETCLEFDPTDADGDGVPDAVSISAPAAFDATVFVDLVDSDGEIDLLISDFPPEEVLPSGTLATLELSARPIPSCTPAFGEVVTAPVIFSTDPPPSFGDTAGQSVPGQAVGGSIEILPGRRGDVNADTLVDAGDISAVGLEIFDGDGDFWRDAPGGTFPGTPVGADANVDTVIDAGDFSCIARLIFGLSCDPPPVRGIDDPPVLGLSTRQLAGDVLLATVELTRAGHPIDSLALSIDVDGERVAIDPTDLDGDGVADAIRFPTDPATRSAEVELDDVRGEIDVLLADFGVPLAEGAVVEIELTSLAADWHRAVAFSARPAPSFGDSSGRSVPGQAVVGMLFADGFESGNTESWSSVVP